jgi:voltage-gated potassium channel Kch
VLVLAIDDVEASVRTAELMRRHFPGTLVIGRARNRQHAFRLMEAGVADITRETLASSLEMAQSTLVALGTTRDTRRRKCDGSACTTRRRCASRRPSRTMKEKMIATTQASARQLESLFEADSAG